ncbi:TetR/AcrR family transcriptional regulator [Streptomyces sp. NBC_01803]|uniref:TetR/AcrR family transcriptional regulator n=1 Tax=Streptomyces sp. NBC_01803 TaxID=2975946 RepID=UPI002DDC41F2|nr:TetR/AcrR family transcriptional regulator [Streptomyces sp. NBC_01803]WSA47409.1 TetR/AcrR family transcriptional regulator [Streptomyces sp. NBC_01803]
MTRRDRRDPTTGGAAGPRPRGGLADKRRAILAGALTVFARDGYTRAGVDAIAAEAGVSTRTIYNHFTDKAELFRSVIQESATRAADAQIEIIDRHLRKVMELEADLVAFGLDWAAQSTAGHAEHFSLTRQINAERGHIPRSAIDAWQEIGPLRVRRVLADRLRVLIGRGLLRDGDPERAALHLMRLVSVTNPSYPGATTPGDDEITEAVEAGVRAFLHGYLS